ncbi:MAG: hypothetical protein ACTHLX_09005 [Candidatus Binatia bacterium]
MSETKAARFTLELITNCMHELARELGAMDPDDPRKATVAAELSQLMQLRRSVRLAGDPVIEQCIDDLVGKMVTSKPPRWTEIFEEVVRLTHRPKEIR